jgi:hypothetical protein
VREKYRQTLLAALPAERARREELKRKAEIERLAKLERERLEKLEKERIAKEAEEKALAERLRLAEEQKARDAVRLAAEERSKRSFRGYGQEATSTFSLSEGLAVVTLKHRGSRNFIVDLLNDHGNGTVLLTNTIGSCSISRAVRVDSSGRYLLNVKADGAWEIVITQPLPHQTEYRFFFDGNGTTATEQFKLLDGLCKIKLKHRGSRNFIVDLLNDEGKHVENVVNEIGNYDGSQAVKVKKEGTYIFDVIADGEWSIELD